MANKPEWDYERDQPLSVTRAEQLRSRQGESPSGTTSEQVAVAPKGSACESPALSSNQHLSPEKIRELAERSNLAYTPGWVSYGTGRANLEKFAALIIDEIRAAETGCDAAPVAVSDLLAECARRFASDVALSRPHPLWGAIEAYENARAGVCVCGEPATEGVQHRTDGPCFVLETTAPRLLFSTTPVAWMKGHRSYRPAEPDDYDVEAYVGDEPPGNGEGWLPLYRKPVPFRVSTWKELRALLARAKSFINSNYAEGDLPAFDKPDALLADITATLDGSDDTDPEVDRLKAENSKLLAETSRWAQMCTGRHGSQQQCIDAPFPVKATTPFLEKP